MTTEEPMLEACPFCGCHGLSSAYPRIIREKACGVVECHTDSCGAMVVADTLPHAIAAWNTRVSRTPPVDQDEVERMRARIVELDAECERAWESYRIAHDQAMANGEALANARHLLNGDASIGSGAGDVRLREALEAIRALRKLERRTTDMWFGTISSEVYSAFAVDGIIDAALKSTDTP